VANNTVRCADIRQARRSDHPILTSMGNFQNRSRVAVRVEVILNRGLVRRSVLSWGHDQYRRFLLHATGCRNVTQLIERRQQMYREIALKRACAVVGLLQIGQSAIWPQSQTPNPPAFEAASMKVSAPSDRPNVSRQGGPGTTSPGQWTITDATVRSLVNLAWDLNRFQLSGPPSIDSERYNIVAKLPPDANQTGLSLDDSAPSRRED